MFKINIKEHKESFIVAGSIAAAGIIGLSIIGRKNLSYLLNQSVKFKNLEQARDFGKTKIIKALKKKDPYEQLVIIDKKTNTIIAQAKGTKDCVKTDAFNVMRPSGSFSVEHGHPTCCLINGKPATMPVSFDDYKTSIWWHGAEDVIAYDVNGKFSMLRRKPNFRRLSAKEIEYYDNLQMKICDEVYLPKMLEHLPKEFHTATSGKQLRNIYNTLKQNGKLTKDLDTQFQKAFNELNSESPELLLKIDKFWRTYADDLGVIYKSNYEYLKTSTANKSSDFLNALFSDESINFDLLMKISNYLVKNAKNVRNINIIKEAYFKRDFATLEKICSRNLKTITSTNKIAKEDLVKQINQEFANKKKIDVNTLTDSEVHNLAKLFGTTEEQIRHMDKKEFRRLCLQYLPDRNQNDSMSSQIFIILNKIFPG